LHKSWLHSIKWFFAVFGGVPKDVWGDAIGFSIPTGLTKEFLSHIAERAISIPPKTAKNRVTPLHPLAGKDLRKIRPFPRPMFIKHMGSSQELGITEGKCATP
jgi:hypothetical protein